eukprot:ANDGO_01104.mRNA.1 hypothetical protein
MSAKKVQIDEGALAEELEQKFSNVGRVDAFSGTMSEDVTLWVNRFEMLSKVNNWSTQKRLAHLCVSLKGTAELWLYSQSDVIRGDYEKLRDSLVRSFSPVVGNSMFLRRKLMNVTQGAGQTVDAYAFEVRNMCSRINSHMADEEVVTYFVNGLHPVIQEYVLLQGSTSFEQCLEAARRKEYLLMTSGVGLMRSTSVNAVTSGPSDVEKRFV